MALQARRTTLCLRSLPTTTSSIVTRAASTSAYPHTITTSKPPPYPYGPTLRYRRADSGLYGASSIQFGNKVSDKNELKSRRVWRPNIHNKRLWSNFLGKFVQVKVQARVLRTIDKLGGLDEYLVGSDTPARVKELGVAGWGLRWRVMQTRAYRERVVVERRSLGLPEQGWENGQKERRRAKRRGAVKVAEAYLNALNEERVGERRSPSVEKELENATGDVVEEIEASASEEHEEAENDVEPEYEVDENSSEQDRQIAQQVDSALETPPPVHPPLQSSVLFGQLAELADALHSSPQTLLKQARDIRQHRTQQLAAHTARTARLAEEQAQLASDIDTALASPNPGPLLDLHREQLAIARDEAALARAHAGKPPLSPAQVQLHVHGPASNTPADKWAEVRARVKAIGKAQPARLQERRARHARNVERRRYWQEHREEFVAERERKRREAGLAGAVRGLGYGLKLAPRGVVERLKGLVGMSGGRGKAAQRG